MNDFLKTLSNIRSLRVALRELPFEQLKEAKEKFDTVYSELEESHLTAQIALEERAGKIEEFAKMLKDAGIDPIDLVAAGGSTGAAVTAKAKREPRPAKYSYTIDGVTKTWTGQGRMPSPIAEAISAGKALEDFLL
ncbi:H-NS family histone-like protein [Aeromonas sp. QDB07]|uniref:H-NS family histone-like protein n=1 Tax=Aeromonas sp. QDB07 TaxID=2989838 RepID=UPI0022E1C7C2|nr:H-NS family nucleoid-associated regulatory protein [Aeromonas sp. QDB07]